MSGAEIWNERSREHGGGVGMARNDLVEGIVQLCQVDCRPFKVRIAEALGHLASDAAEAAGADMPLPEKADPAPRGGDPFQIPRKEQPLWIASQEAYDEYVRNIQDLGELKSFLQQYGGEQSCRSYVPFVEKIIQSVSKHEPPAYDKKENNAERLAGFVDKRILKGPVKKISKAAFRLLHAEEEWTRPPEMLIVALNSYLERLGVYTVIAQPGESYSAVIDYYDVGNREPSEDTVSEVEYPAYVLEFLDDDGSLEKCTLSGRCFLKARERCED